MGSNPIGSTKINCGGQVMLGSRRFSGLGLTICAIFLTGQARKKPPVYFNYDSNGLSATGEWVPLDPKIKASTIPSETEIDCFRPTLSCVEATAEYYFGNPHVSVGYLQVIKWDEDGIIASDSSGACMTVTMQVAFGEKRITSTHSLKKLDAKLLESCKFFGADKAEEDIFVLKNSERWIKEHSLALGESKK